MPRVRCRSIGILARREFGLILNRLGSDSTTVKGLSLRACSLANERSEAKSGPEALGDFVKAELTWLNHSRGINSGRSDWCSNFVNVQSLDPSFSMGDNWP